MGGEARRLKDSSFSGQTDIFHFGQRFVNLSSVHLFNISFNFNFKVSVAGKHTFSILDKDLSIREACIFSTLDLTLTLKFQQADRYFLLWTKICHFDRMHLSNFNFNFKVSVGGYFPFWTKICQFE